jgi:hypothetical protein
MATRARCRAWVTDGAAPVTERDFTPDRPVLVAGPARPGFTVLIAGVVWYTLFRSDAPDYQDRIDMPGMGVHLVNLWAR